MVNFARARTQVLKILAFAVILIIGMDCRPPNRMVRNSGGNQKSGKRTEFLFFKSKIPRSKYRSSDRIRVSLGTHRKVTMMARAGYRIREVKSGRLVGQGRRKIHFSKLTPGKSYNIQLSDGAFMFNGRAYRGGVILHAYNGKMLVVNHLPIEDYLYGVVPSEMSASWHVEALKAQAICARTYALKRMKTSKNPRYDLDASTASQVYKGLAVETPKVRHAVDSTAGKVLIHKGKLINAFFYSSCGGKTEEAHFVWGAKDPSTQTKRCNFCKQSKRYAWRSKASPKKMQAVARRLGIGRYKSTRIIKRSPSKRVAIVEVVGSKGKKRLKGNQFRLKLGAQTVRSTRFRMKSKKGGLFFAGRGWGHGVGMCQYGALGQAVKGKNHKRILAYYYKNTKLVTKKRRKSSRRLASLF